MEEVKRQVGPILDCLFYIKRNPGVSAEEWDSESTLRWCSQPQTPYEWYLSAVEPLIGSVKRELELGFATRHKLMMADIMKSLALDET